MEFNLDFLKKTGEALSSFSTKEDEEIKVYSEEEDTRDTTQESVTTARNVIKEKDNIDSDEVVVEPIKTEKDKKKNEEENLEKKLANIEKVIDKFSGGTTTLPSSKDLVGNSNSNINIKPLDFGQMQAKADQQEYLKPSSVPNDRIALLYKDLEKYNLI